MDLSILTDEQLKKLKQQLILEDRKRGLDKYTNKISKKLSSNLFYEILFYIDIYDSKKGKTSPIFLNIEKQLNDHLMTLPNIENYTSKDFNLTLNNSISNYVYRLQNGGEWSGNLSVSWIKNLMNGISEQKAFISGDRNVYDVVKNQYNFNSQKRNDSNTFENLIYFVKTLKDRKIELILENKKTNTNHTFVIYFNHN